MDLRKLDRRIAEWVGDEGINPKPYSSSLDLLVPVVERWQVGKDCSINMGRELWTSEWSAHIEFYTEGKWQFQLGDTAAEALALAFVAVLDKEGGE